MSNKHHVDTLHNKILCWWYFMAEGLIFVKRNDTMSYMGRTIYFNPLPLVWHCVMAWFLSGRWLCAIAWCLSSGLVQGSVPIMYDPRDSLVLIIPGDVLFTPPELYYMRDGTNATSNTIICFTIVIILFLTTQYQTDTRATDKVKQQKCQNDCSNSKNSTVLQYCINIYLQFHNYVRLQFFYCHDV